MSPPWMVGGCVERGATAVADARSLLSADGPDNRPARRRCPGSGTISCALTPGSSRPADAGGSAALLASAVAHPADPVRGTPSLPTVHAGPGNTGLSAPAPAWVGLPAGAVPAAVRRADRGWGTRPERLPPAAWPRSAAGRPGAGCCVMGLAPMQAAVADEPMPVLTVGSAELSIYGPAVPACSPVPQPLPPCPPRPRRHRRERARQP